MRVYTVRPAEQMDAESIASVAIQAWNRTYGSIYPRDLILRFVSAAYSSESLHSSISNDSGRAVRLFHVALDPYGNIVGYSQSKPEGNNCTSLEILRIYALPDSVGTGVGTALLNHLFLTCPEVATLSAWVEERNAIGRRFYENHGFISSDQRDEEFLGLSTRQLKYIWHRYA